MKRNWDLIRKILLAVEDLPTPQQVVTASDIKGTAPEVVNYHLQLLKEAGLVKGSCSNYLDGSTECHISQLTWNGHEFLDAIRNQTAWHKTLTVLRDKGLDLSFDTIKAAAAQVAASVIGG